MCENLPVFRLFQECLVCWSTSTLTRRDISPGRPTIVNRKEARRGATRMAVAPGLPTGIHAVRVRRHTWPWHDGVFAQGLAGLVLHMHHAIPHHLTATLQHPQDGRSCLCSGLVQRFLTPLLCHACLF